MKIFNILIGLIFVLNAGAQDSLSYYLTVAVNRNPVVSQKYYEYQAAIQRIHQAGGLTDPELSMGVFVTPMELVSGQQVADLRLMQMFPWFGTLRNAKDEMKQMAGARYEAFRDARSQLVFDVRSSWYELYKLKQVIRIMEKNTDLLHAIERISLVRFSAAPSGNSAGRPADADPAPGASRSTSGIPPGMQGMEGSTTVIAGSASMQGSSYMQGSGMNGTGGGYALSDLYRLQIEIGELENGIALQKSRLKTGIARFNSFLNRPAQTPVVLPGTLVPDTLDMDLQMVENGMLSDNPMVAMLQFEQQSLDSRKKMVTRMGYPMIGVGLNYSLIRADDMSTSEMNGKDMIMPMLSVSLPIYRGKYKALRKEAELLKTAAGSSLASSANNLSAEYYQAVEMYEDARRRIKLYAGQALLAEKSLNIMLTSFSASGSGLTEVLRIRQQVLDYETGIVEAVADCNIAVAWLKKLGSLDGEMTSVPSPDTGNIEKNK